MSTPSIFSAVKHLRSLLTPEQKWQWVGIACFALLTSILEMITALVIVVFAQVLNNPTASQKYLHWLPITQYYSSGQVVFYIAIFCGLIYLVKNIIAGLEVFHQNFAIQKMNDQFTDSLMRRYAKSDYEYYLSRNSALGASVISDDVDQVFSVGMVSLASILSEGIIFICLILTIILMSPILALIVFTICAVVGVVINKGLLPLFYRWGRRFQEASILSKQNLMQFFSAFKEIVLLGKREEFLQGYQFFSRKKSRVKAIQNATNALPRMVIEVLFVGLFVVTVSILCLKFESPDAMTGILGGYLYVGFRLMPGLNRIINYFNNFKAVIPAIELTTAEYHAKALQENYCDAPHFQFNQSITFNQVSFRYLNTTMDALRNLSFQIQKGECIGIIGATGSGKSTLVDMLLGLLHPYQGSILIDQQFPVYSLQLHRCVGYVPQSVYLIDDTILANIAFGEKTKKVDFKRIHQTVENAQLSQLIRQLPMGLSTLVGERGVRLSGGERQRIAIARALYHNPDVLIFDEATSALDNETEARLMETIYSVSRNRTVIMIAHRLTTLKNFHRIIELSQGSIKHVMSYSELQLKSASTTPPGMPP